MVTKPAREWKDLHTSSVLAKIHMVTKLYSPFGRSSMSSVLAKIHMVTKQAKKFID